MDKQQLTALCRARGAIGFDYETNPLGEINWYRLRFAFEGIDPMVSVSIVQPSRRPVEPPPVAPQRIPEPVAPEPIPEPLPFENIPQAMRAVPRWCVWQKQDDGRKIPFRVLPGGLWSTAKQCKSNTPEMWVSFDEALHCFLKFNDQLGGLSFALGDSWYGVDFDDVIVNGQMHAQAEAWLASLGGYQEISQSKQGKKTVGRGVLSDVFLERPEKTGRQFKGIPTAGMQVEVYDKRRFFFLTGEGSGEPRENQAGLNAFCDELLALWDQLKAEMQPKPKSSTHVARGNGETTLKMSGVDTKALDYIDHNALTYEEWLSVITACKSAGLSSQEVDAWSRRGGVRYTEREVESRWHGLNLNISWGAVINLAKRNGYVPLTKADAAMARLRNRSKGEQPNG